MAWSKQHKEKTRQKILDCAASRFSQRGFDAVTIDEIMTDAELTRGAFYTHFSSKKQLYAEAIKTAGLKSSKKLQERANEQDMLRSLIACYLSPEHCAEEHASCPIALLITDIAHRDETVRNAYTDTLRGFVKNIETHAAAERIDMDSGAAIETAVAMIGGLALARAVNDPALKSRILQASQSLGLRALDNE